MSTGGGQLDDLFKGEVVHHRVQAPGQGGVGWRDLLDEGQQGRLVGDAGTCHIPVIFLSALDDNAEPDTPEGDRLDMRVPKKKTQLEDEINSGGSENTFMLVTV